jgi:hypothetical protein
MNKKNPQNGGTGGIKLVRQKGRPNASLQEFAYHGKNPNARKKSPKSVPFLIVAISRAVVK